MALSECVGDGLAKVTVSGDMAVNDFGTKAGAFVSVNVTCGNSEEEISMAHDVARDMVHKLLQEDIEDMEALLDSRLNKGKEPEVKASKVSQAPKPSPRKSTKQVKAKKSDTSRPKVKRPSFRR